MQKAPADEIINLYREAGNVDTASRFALESGRLDTAIEIAGSAGVDAIAVCKQAGIPARVAELARKDLAGAFVAVSRIGVPEAAFELARESGLTRRFVDLADRDLASALNVVSGVELPETLSMLLGAAEVPEKIGAIADNDLSRAVQVADSIHQPEATVELLEAADIPTRIGRTDESRARQFQDFVDAGQFDQAIGIAKQATGGPAGSSGGRLVRRLGRLPSHREHEQPTQAIPNPTEPSSFGDSSDQGAP